MPLMTRKTIDELIAEANTGSLHRTLGAFSLTTLGVGAIIGAGIFVITGTAAAQFAGPALVISMIIAAVGCAFAGLCYAEFASMIPVAGSAYTYAYATLGELLAWIIGWDLVLEYAMAAAVVAAVWANYLNELLVALNIRPVPEFLCSDPFSNPDAWFNPPAVLILMACKTVLV